MHKVFVSIAYPDVNSNLKFYSDFFIFGGELDEEILNRIKLEFSKKILCNSLDQIVILSINYIKLPDLIY